jgi:hypothetical protein
MNEDKSSTVLVQPLQSPHQIRLPGFIATEAIGFGDLIKRTTSHFGIQPCDSCLRRADQLNRWIVFVGRELNQ